MGGYGSGRRPERVAVEDCLTIDVGLFRRRGLLKPGSRGECAWSRHGQRTGAIGFHAEEERIVLDYRCRGEAITQTIWLTDAPCHYGGSRLWFECPHCGRNAGKLHLAPGRRYFECRDCYGLTYESRREDPDHRMRRRATRLCLRLGDDPHCDQIPPKPKGMHWRTYHRLLDEIQGARHLSDCHYFAKHFRLRLNR